MAFGQKSLMLGAVALTLAACSQSEPRLMNLRSSSSSPDEFAILPTKPIEIPKNLAALPEPTPGGLNRTDVDPHADATAALGGRTANRPGIPTSDAALVNAASRKGVSTNIRQTLAAEDLAFRDKNRGRPLERLFGVTVYYKSYEPMSLDQHQELARLRRLGVRVPAAPPKITE